MRGLAGVVSRFRVVLALGAALTVLGVATPGASGISAVGRSNVAVSTAPTSGGTWSSSGGTYTFTPNASDANVNSGELAGYLSTANVVIDNRSAGGNQAGNITLAANTGSASSYSLSIDAAGSITQTAGALAVGGTTSLAASGGSIVLGNSQNSLNTVTLSAAQGATVSTSGALTAGAMTTASGNLTLTSGGALTVGAQPISTAGSLSLTTIGGSAINLLGSPSAPGGETFNGPVVLGNDVSLSSNGGISFTGAVNGAYALQASAPSTVFGGAVGANTPLTSVTTGSAGATVINGGAIRTSGDQTYNNPVVLGANATLTPGGQVTAGSTVALGTYTLTVAGAGALQGAVSGTGGLTKQGAGTLQLQAANAYTGTTTVSSGRLQVDADTSSSAVSLTGGTLAGIGGVGAITASGGTVAPGDSPGVLQASTTSFNAATTFAPVLNGDTVGSGYAQLDVLGAGGATPDVVLGGAQLSPTLGYRPAAGQTFVILRNDGTKAVSGTFAGLAEGATLTLGSVPMRISYVGGDGNDVTLTVQRRVTTTQVQCAPGAVTVGDQVTCTATVTDTDSHGPAQTPTGSVAFTADGPGSFDASSCALSGSGASASCSVHFTPSAAQTTNVTGAYPDGSIHAASQNSAGVTVSARSTSTSVSCSPALVTVAQATSCTAVVTDTGTGTPSAPTGTVSFRSDSAGTFAAGGTCTLSATAGAGRAACSLTYTPNAVGSGTHGLTATYGADSAHATSAGTTSVTVSSPPPAPTTPAPPATPAPPSPSPAPTVPPPSVRITAATYHGSYRVGETVRVRFRCIDRTGGPGIGSCVDSNGARGSVDTGSGSAGTGTLNTRRPGSFTYSVTARTRDGHVAVKRISYTVRRPARRAADLRLSGLAAVAASPACRAELNQAVTAAVGACTTGRLTMSGTIDRSADGQRLTVTARARIAGRLVVVVSRTTVRRGRFVLVLTLPGRDTDGHGIPRLNTGGDRWSYRISYSGSARLSAARRSGSFTWEVEPA